MSTPENTDCEGTMKPGKVGWNELITSDPAGAIAYYTAMFGWETEAFPMPQGEYTMFKYEGAPFGGVMKKPHDDVPTHWLNYVSVADVEASIAQSTSLGGAVILPPMDIPDVGRIAVVKDPQGAVIGLHQGLKK